MVVVDARGPRNHGGRSAIALLAAGVRGDRLMAVYCRPPVIV